MKTSPSHFTTALQSFIFRTTTNSVSSLNWSKVTSGIVDDGTTKTLIVNPPTGNRFYRLHKL